MFLRLVLILFSCAFVCASGFPLCPAGMAGAAELSRLEKEAWQAWSDAARSLGLQTELPLKARGGEAAGSEQDKEPPAEASTPILSKDLSTYILYVSIFVILILIILNLRDNLWSRSRSRRLIREGDDFSPAASAVARKPNPAR